MPPPILDREVIVVPWTPHGELPEMVAFAAYLQGILVRMEARIEQLQDQVMALEARVNALEYPVQAQAEQELA